MKKIYLICLLGILPIQIIQAATDQVPMDRTITSIHAYDSFVFINFTPDFNFNQGCTNPDTNHRISIDTSNELGKNLYSAALSAAAAQKKVGFGVSGCHNDRSKAFRIDVEF